MSRDDATLIYAYKIKKTRGGHVVVRKVYSVKWAQGDPDCMTTQEFTSAMSGHLCTMSLEKAIRLAYTLDAEVGGSEHGVVLVEHYQDVVVSGDVPVNPSSRLPYFPDQSDIHAQYAEWAVPVSAGPLIYTKWGDCYTKYEFGLETPDPVIVAQKAAQKAAEEAAEEEAVRQVVKQATLSRIRSVEKALGDLKTQTQCLEKLLLGLKQSLE